jgi:hypothetical protein
MKANILLYRRVYRRVFIIVVASYLSLSVPTASAGWVHNFLGVPLGTFQPFKITGIESSEEGDHVIGKFSFVNYKEGEKPPAPVMINGGKKSDNTFWPDVVAQVADDDDNWKAIGKPSTSGTITVSLMVPAKVDPERFYVNLDIFRPIIGKKKYGRIVLETGDSAIFELNDLLPPKIENKAKPESSAK